MPRFFYAEESGSNDRNGNRRRWITLFDASSGLMVGDRTRVPMMVDDPHTCALEVAMGLGHQVGPDDVAPLGGHGFRRFVARIR